MDKIRNGFRRLTKQKQCYIFQIKYGTSDTVDLALQKKYFHSYLSVRQLRPAGKSDLLSWIKFSKHTWFNNEKQSIYVLDVVLSLEKLEKLWVLTLLF